MANANLSADTTLPDWWQREKRRRQTYFLVFLIAVLLLIAYYYFVSLRGITFTPGITFDTTDYVAFVKHDKDGNAALYAVRADGSGQRRLSEPDDKSSKETPAWTTDGKRLLYASNLNDGRTWQIYLLGNGDPKQLTYGTGNKFAPIASPDGQHAAFVTQGAIKTVYLNGNDVYQVMPPPTAESGQGEEAAQAQDALNTLKGPFLMAAISSDGRGFAGVKEPGSEDNVLVVPEYVLGSQVVFALPATGEKSVMLDTGREVSLCWEPNGARLASAFSQMQLKTPDNAGVKNSGSEEKMSETYRAALKELKSLEKGATVNVNGINIWSFDAAGRATAKRLLLTDGATLEPHNIAWSPDGARLAFEGWRVTGEDKRENLGIFVIGTDQPMGIRTVKEVDAFLPYRIVAASADGEPLKPRWSPDGKRLLYEVARKDGGHDIWVINADKTNPVNLTKGDGDNSQAAWSPLYAK